MKLSSDWVGCRARALLCLIVPPVSLLPLAPLLPLQVLNITCSCVNGLAPIVWPAGSLPGHGGNLTNIVFDGARVFRSNMAVAIKSLEKFVGCACTQCSLSRRPASQLVRSTCSPVHTRAAPCPRDHPVQHPVVRVDTRIADRCVRSDASDVDNPNRHRQKRELLKLRSGECRPGDHDERFRTGWRRHTRRRTCS